MCQCHYQSRIKYSLTNILLYHRKIFLDSQSASVTPHAGQCTLVQQRRDTGTRTEHRVGEAEDDAK